MIASTGNEILSVSPDPSHYPTVGAYAIRSEANIVILAFNLQVRVRIYCRSFPLVT